MSEWKKTSCVLCAQNCGLQALVENNRIVKVKPDKDNPRSQGYACRKGLNITYYQHHSDRLTYPLKKVGNDFVPISWEQALTEIAEKLRSIVDEHGPRSLAFMGLGGLGGHSEAVFGLRLLRSLGSKYYYNALAGELTGLYWGYGRTIGRQYNFTIFDHDQTDLLLAIGWNGWMSHQMPQARRYLDKMSKDLGKMLVVIDPRRSETAKKADIHLALRPGTDALLTRALIAIILQEGWQNQSYIDLHVSQFEQIDPWFKDFDAREACRVCELDYDQVKEVARLFATRKSSLHADLGVLMGRHSSVTTYLEIILLAICGRLFVPGGNVVPGCLMTMGPHTDDRNPKHWKTMSTGFPTILGMHPPNAMPEEIDNNHPERLRAVLISSSNPVRSFADTTAYEQAFSKLDLLVTIDIAMTETAKMSDYVLPDRSLYERWDTTYFQLNYPEIYCQMRQPMVKPEGELLEGSEIFTRLADKLGFIPAIPESLYSAAKKSRIEYGQALYAYMKSEPKVAEIMPFVVAKTLGKEMGSVNLAWMWALLQNVPQSFKENAVRAGFKLGLTMGDDIFQAILDHPEGLWIGKVDPDNNFANLKTEDNRINLYIPEVEEWVTGITPEYEEEQLQSEGKYPFVLLAGRHMDDNANTLMRNPEWNRGRRACTVAMNPEDAEGLGLNDQQIVKVTTEAGTVNIELETTTDTRPGMVIIPHGFGLEFNGETFGVGVNRLTKNTNRDRLAGTPLHRYVRCQVEAVIDF
ncbi:molybdopterin-containing oxidoreductase family protein [Desulfosporosinus shakirovi]|uniref:molybdopterin-containing oxidoreductase family protein n=1 Tax=Desulfosporosinus shakirovi TaxID=2885154 RepID=UPI001E28660C|nr:molybdopterin-dependent oxidoreductase [Desulfosporosinus sp. SRJS8]MCB8814327.1 molybdopterin-dependent oxidoreductase [Desulfosporosinus sp. SRJS8]